MNKIGCIIIIINMTNITKIQSVFRGYSIRKKTVVIPSYIQTKEWRKNQK